jgi:DNA-binding FrmR family transcriptional regulator
MVPQHHLLTTQKGDPTFLDNHLPIALMNNLLKLWNAQIEDSGSKYAETHGILSEQKDGFRLLRRIHDALASIMMMMEDAQTCNKDIYIMYADFKGAFNAVDHRIMLKHIRQLAMSSTFVDTCEQLHGVSTTDYITPYGSTPSIDIKRGTLHGDTLSPFMCTLYLEPFLRWLTVDSRGYRSGAPTTNDDPTECTATYPATDSPTTSASQRNLPST